MLRLFVATCARSWVRTPVEKNNLYRPLTNVVASRFMSSEPTIPPYEDKFDEPLHEKRARLMYQVRIFDSKVQLWNINVVHLANGHYRNMVTSREKNLISCQFCQPVD